MANASFSKLDLGIEDPFQNDKGRIHVSDTTGLSTNYTCLPKKVN